jgi:hypothetical protein
MTDNFKTHLPGLRVHLLPAQGGDPQDMTLDLFASIRAEQLIDNKYGSNFRYFLDDNFSWLEDYLNGKGPPCSYCL